MSAAQTTSPVAATFPYTVLDELFLNLERDGEPWTIQVEVEVDARLEDERLRAALHTAMAVHPLALARREPITGLEYDYTWRVCAEPDVDPFSVVDCDGEAALAQERRELYSTPIPLGLAPPLRVRLAHLPGRDVLMLCVHHAAFDGVGAVRLLRAVAAGYGDLEPADSDVDVIGLAEAREMPETLVPRGLRGLLRRAGHQGRLLRELADAPARLAPSGDRDEPGYRFVHRSLAAGGLGRRPGQPEGPTANDRLLATVHLSVERWNADHGRPTGRVAVMMPVNLRPPAWRTKVVANLATIVTVSTNAADRVSPDACLAAVHRTTRRLRRPEAVTSLLPALRLGRPLPLLLRSLILDGVMLGTRDRVVDTVALSNLGRIEPLVGLPAHETAQVWFSPPARMPLGLAIGVVTVGDRTHVVLRHRPPLLGPHAARAFADLFVATLDRFATPAPDSKGHD